MLVVYHLPAGQGAGPLFITSNYGIHASVRIELVRMDGALLGA
ncbi:unnamed protein product [Ectocarpus sp. CCAP 1310/34]|nr:unnamed protein product [Ectocarpus sp. CCAP 1310/34]